jgi:hypothetical protein
MTDCIDVVPQRFEQCTEESLAAAAWNCGDSRLQRQRRPNEFGFALAPSTQSGVEPTRKDDRQQGRSDVGAIVDVLVLGPAFAATATNHPNWINVEHDCCRAGLLRRFRIEDRRVPKWELPRVDVVRVLVEEEP